MKFAEITDAWAALKQLGPDYGNKFLFFVSFCFVLFFNFPGEFKVQPELRAMNLRLPLVLGFLTQALKPQSLVTALSWTQGQVRNAQMILFRARDQRGNCSALIGKNSSLQRESCWNIWSLISEYHHLFGIRPIISASMLLPNRLEIEWRKTQWDGQFTAFIKPIARLTASVYVHEISHLMSSHRTLGTPSFYVFDLVP